MRVPDSQTNSDFWAQTQFPDRDESKMFNAVVGNAEFEPLFAHGLAQVANEVAVRPQLFRVIFVHRAVPERKAVVMLGRGDDYFRAGFFEQRGPGVRVELLASEHRDEIFVAKLVRRAEFLRVPLRDRRVAIPMLLIPLTGMGGHGVKS